MKEHRPSWFDSRERAWWAVILAILAVLGVACWLALFFGRTDLGQDEKGGGQRRGASADSPLDERGSPSGKRQAGPAARLVYAYSVIPGGIRTVAELKTAIARDPVVSAEYSNFRLEDARVLQLEADRAVYLAYRVGGRVFWTSRKVTLEKGETVITDGNLIARAKCGNLISDSLEAPVSPDGPTELALNTPVDVRYDPGGPETDDRFPELSPPAPSNVPPPSYEPPVYEPPYPGPPAGVNPWSGGGEPVFPIAPPPPIVHSQGTPPPSPPVINTPEPSTGAQFLLAAAAILFLLWRAKARQRLEANGGTR
jgi:hypothetical protein